MVISKIMQNICIGLLSFFCLANCSSLRAQANQANNPDITIKLREPERFLEQKIYDGEKINRIFEDNLNRHYMRKFGLNYLDAGPKDMARDFLRVAKSSVRDWAETTDAYFILKDSIEEWINNNLSFTRKELRIGLGISRDEDVYDELRDLRYSNRRAEYYKARLGIGTSPYLGIRLGNDIIHLRLRYDEFRAEIRKELWDDVEFRAGAGADYGRLGEIKFFARIQKRIGNYNGIMGIGANAGRIGSRYERRTFNSDLNEKKGIEVGAFLTYRF